ncbi:hypothetical protein GCM10010918_16430 [Paenibacillus radicis (ex Gao et al. 2016)]|uniref:Uncharacterized protein n=1 Tax=Paenibacillus radicis (ex Gao et al. 2016) TaxID=1737354 RepID=A0A917H0V0_9BACL|nr:hypothetical protein GCM10010918_16430 [Paenibacillus radicis (ex Gao et al. 2016)]
MIDGERNVNTDDKRIELNIREILQQLEIPQDKWPAELIVPISMNR